MTLSRWPTVVLAATVCLFAVPLALGNAGARIGAALGLAGLVGGLWLAADRLRRVEHADDERPPSRLALVGRLADSASRSVVSVACIVAFLFLAVVAPGSGSRAEAGWLGPAMAIAVSLPLCGGLVSTWRLSLRRDGFERDAFLRSTSTAFFVTMVGCGSYATFEVLADAPAMPAFAPWTLGILTWLVANAWITRRAS